MRVPINNYWVTAKPANIMFDQIMKGCLVGLPLSDTVYYGLNVCFVKSLNLTKQAKRFNCILQTGF